MKGIVIGHTCSIGQAIMKALVNETVDVDGWSRSNGKDIFTCDLYGPDSFGIVVLVPEIGLAGLWQAWVKIRDCLDGVFIFLSSIAALMDSTDYAKSKQQQEALLPKMAKWSARVRVNCIRLGHVSPSSTWPDGVALSNQFLKVFVRPEDVARCVLFMFKTPSITGSIVTIDSGILLQ